MNYDCSNKTLWGILQETTENYTALLGQHKNNLQPKKQKQKKQCKINRQLIQQFQIKLKPT